MMMLRETDEIALHALIKDSGSADLIGFYEVFIKPDLVKLIYMNESSEITREFFRNIVRENIRLNSGGNNV